MPASRSKSGRAWWLYVGISAGVVLLLTLGIAFMLPGRQVAQAPSGSSQEEESGPDLLRQQSDRMSAELVATVKPDDSAEAADASVDEAPADADAAESLPEPEMQPEESSLPAMSAEEPGVAEPAPAPAVGQVPKVGPAEVARRELLEKQRAIETTYAAAMKPVEEKVTTWDFVAAWEAAEGVRFDEAELMARLEARREEIKQMELLKWRIITKIGQANPPLKKSDLRIRGAGGEITDAGPAGLTTKTIRGEVERLTWNDLGTQAAGKLVELVVDPANGEDCFAAGLLAFASGDRAASERFFAKAKAAGADVSAQLAAVAASSLAEANELLAQKKFAKAVSMLEILRSKYADLPWFTAHRETIDAALATGERGVREEEAEALYAQGVKFHEDGELFDLRDVVERLKNEYADCRPVIETGRTPSVADLEKAVAELGARLIVRLDGEGDFTSIQAAIDAAGPNSLIEIWDDGPYSQKLVVADEKTGLTIRGAPANWPIITCRGAEGETSALIEVLGPKTRIEHVLVVSTDVLGRTPFAIRFDGAGQKPNRIVMLRQCLVCGADIRNRYSNWSLEECLIISGFQLVNAGVAGISPYLGIIDNSILFGRRSDGSLRSYILQRARIDSSVVNGSLRLGEGPNQIVNSVLQDAVINPDFPDHEMDFCGIIGKVECAVGEHCVAANPQFRDPANLDFRLMPDSPLIGKASDGGDIGVRYTPEMMELCRIALELRAKGVIKF